MRSIRFAVAALCLAPALLAHADPDERAGDTDAAESVDDVTGPSPREERVSLSVFYLINNGFCGSHTDPIWQPVQGYVSWSPHYIRANVGGSNRPGAAALLLNSQAIRTWATGCCVAAGYAGWGGFGPITYYETSGNAYSPPLPYSWTTQATALHLVCFNPGDDSAF